MIAPCPEAKIPPPEYRQESGMFIQAMRRPKIAQVGEQVGEQVLQLLEFCRSPRSKQEMLVRMGLKLVYLNYKRHILPLLEKGLLEMTIPEKPTSRMQKYRLTEKGKKAL